MVFMKTRNGFVSNSSSSSFIVCGKIDDVARSMLNTVIDDFKEWHGEKTKVQLTKEMRKYEKWTRNLKLALNNDDVQKGRVGITMPSCNYDTYIVQAQDKVYVSTANNHQWNLDNVVKSGCSADDGEDDIAYKIIHDVDFFNVRNKLVHSHEKWISGADSRCPKCKYGWGYVVCKGKQLCSYCYKELK